MQVAARAAQRLWPRTARRAHPAVLGAGLGFGVCSGAAVACRSDEGDEGAAADVPPFSFDEPRYDQSNYGGRLRSILDMIDPRTLFVSSEELVRNQIMLADTKRGERPAGVTDADLWAAQKNVNAIIHPATGEEMLLVGRMSAFVPTNVPIAMGMLMHGPTGTAATVFWQWVNQSYNVLNNYTCRAGKEVEMGPLMTSYGLAVGASVSIALASGRAMKAYPGLAKLGPFVPYLAVITAGTCNVAFTRMSEITGGVDVLDADGNVLGKSAAAGKLAVFKTVTTRSMFLPVMPLLVPPATMALLKQARVVRAGTPVAVAIEIAVIAVSMSIGLPCALAILPQRMSLSVDSLEPEFQKLKDKNGNPITTVFANKGL